MRQAYDYWQDQPGNSHVNICVELENSSQRAGRHTTNVGAPHPEARNISRELAMNGSSTSNSPSQLVRRQLEQSPDNQRLCPSVNEQHSDERVNQSHGERSPSRNNTNSFGRVRVLLLAAFATKPAPSPSIGVRRSTPEAGSPGTGEPASINRNAGPRSHCAFPESTLQTFLNSCSTIFQQQNPAPVKRPYWTGDALLTKLSAPMLLVLWPTLEKWLSPRNEKKRLSPRMKITTKSPK